MGRGDALETLKYDAANDKNEIRDNTCRVYWEWEGKSVKIMRKKVIV